MQKVSRNELALCMPMHRDRTVVHTFYYGSYSQESDDEKEKVLLSNNEDWHSDQEDFMFPETNFRTPITFKKVLYLHFYVYQLTI